MSDKIIRLENIIRIYQIGETQVQALRGITYSVNYSEFLAIMGPSGSGKSTLMSILGLLDRPTSGQYFLEGVDVSKLSRDEMAAIRNRKIGFVFQNFNLLSRTSALENVELPMIYSHMSSKEARDRAMTALAAVGLKGWEHHRTNQLNQERNITLIMVTHDPVIASYAKRRLYLKDGQIVGEEVSQGACDRAPASGG
jgi:putative ABC transport system ATP-binding protein